MLRPTAIALVLLLASTIQYRIGPSNSTTDDLLVFGFGATYSASDFVLVAIIALGIACAIGIRAQHARLADARGYGQ